MDLHAHTDPAVSPLNSPITPCSNPITPSLAPLDWGLLYGLGRPSNPKGLGPFKFLTAIISDSQSFGDCRVLVIS